MSDFVMVGPTGLELHSFFETGITREFFKVRIQNRVSWCGLVTHVL